MTITDPAPVQAQPLILNDAYFELTGVNLRCLVQHIEVVPENAQVTVTSFCAETDYPGVTKWHLRVTFYQSFDNGAVYDTLNAARQAYVASGATAFFKARPYASRPVGVGNPEITGQAIPQPFEIIIGDAGAASQVQIDWNLPAEPTVSNAGAPATAGATAGQPGFYTPPGAAIPANLAGLAGVTADPATPWTAGQYVITGDLLAAYWNGTAWAAGKATAAAVAATGATAGTPGTFTPGGATTPANRAALTAGVTASPATAWTTGQSVVTADSLSSYWNGTAWVAGTAP